MSQLSIIVPVYRAEAYLDRCVQSILQQNDSDFELILVDDGSPDNCGYLCDQYAAQDSRIRVIHQENGGISAARNAGIRAATGAYVTFVDADDEIPAGFYKKCRDVLAGENPPDLLCFGLAYLTAAGEKFDVIRPEIPGYVLLNRAFITNKLLPPLLNIDPAQDFFIENYAVNKIYRRSLLVENGILFDETRRTWEDRPFVVEFCKFAQSFYYIPEAGYHYIQTPGSLSVRYAAEKLEIILKNLRHYERLFGDVYDLRCPYAVAYYCRSFLRVGVELAAFRDRREETLSAVSSFCRDPLGQALFSAFCPETSSEKRLQAAVLEQKPDAVFRLMEQELRRRNWAGQWQQSLPMRILRRVKRALIQPRK